VLINLPLTSCACLRQQVNTDKWTAFSLFRYLRCKNWKGNWNKIPHTSCSHKIFMQVASL